jgi:hypothetical protein
MSCLHQNKRYQAFPYSLLLRPEKKVLATATKTDNFLSLRWPPLFIVAYVGISMFLCFRHINTMQFDCRHHCHRRQAATTATMLPPLPPSCRRRQPLPQASDAALPLPWIFFMMIIGQEMADIHHGGGGRTEHFWGLCGVRCFRETARGQKNYQFLRFSVLWLVACRLSGGCAIIITTEKKNLVVCLAGARLLLRPEKKSSSHLSGGCAIVITTRKKKVLVVCLAGARSLLRPEKKKF